MIAALLLAVLLAQSPAPHPVRWDHIGQPAIATTDNCLVWGDRVVMDMAYFVWSDENYILTVFTSRVHPTPPCPPSGLAVVIFGAYRISEPLLWPGIVPGSGELVVAPAVLIPMPYAGGLWGWHSYQIGVKLPAGPWLDRGAMHYVQAAVVVGSTILVTTGKRITF